MTAQHWLDALFKSNISQYWNWLIFKSYFFLETTPEFVDVTGSHGEQLVQIVEEYKNNKIPLNSVFFDIESMKNRSPFTVDRKQYDPPNIKEVNKKYNFIGKQ